MIDEFETFGDFLKRVAPQLTDEQICLIKKEASERLTAHTAGSYEDGYEEGRERGDTEGYERGWYARGASEKGYW